MSRDFLFVSGWAGFSPLFPTLAARGDFLVPFVTHSERDIFDAFDTTCAKTLIAWSTGAHMALKRWARVVERFDRIVLMAPFSAFTDYTSDTAVKLLLRGMKRHPHDVVRQFHADCGFPRRLPMDSLTIDGLVEGLEYLRVSRAAPVHQGAEKTIIIHGEHDKIVPHAASEDIWETLSGASYRALPCGHWITEDEVVEFTE